MLEIMFLTTWCNINVSFYYSSQERAEDEQYVAYPPYPPSTGGIFCNIILVYDLSSTILIYCILCIIGGI